MRDVVYRKRFEGEEGAMSQEDIVLVYGIVVIMIVMGVVLR